MHQRRPVVHPEADRRTASKSCHKLRLPDEDVRRARRSFRTAASTCRPSDNMYCLGTGRSEAVGRSAAGLAEGNAAATRRSPRCRSCRTTSLLTPGKKQEYQRAPVQCAAGNCCPKSLAKDAKFTVDGPGTIAADGTYTAPTENEHQVCARDLQGGRPDRHGPRSHHAAAAVEVRFQQRQDVPLTWLGGRVRWEVREKDGEKFIAKKTVLPTPKDPKNKLGTRSFVWMGPTDLSNYTIQADVLLKEDGGKMPDVGLIASGYQLTIRSREPASCGSIAGRRTTTARSPTSPFEPKPDTWYTLKLSVVPGKGQATVRGKIWPRGETEPEKWTVEMVDQSPNLHGTPGHLRQLARRGNLPRQLARDARTELESSNSFRPRRHEEHNVKHDRQLAYSASVRTSCLCGSNLRVHEHEKHNRSLRWSLRSLTLRRLAYVIRRRCREVGRQRQAGQAQRRVDPMGRLLRAQQHARRPQHSHRVEASASSTTAPARGIPRTSKNIKWVAQARLADLRQPGRRQRQGLRRHQQRRRLAQALPGRSSISAACSASTSRTASSSGSTAARSCPPAASTIGRCRASAARRSSKATGCGSSPAAAKSAASTPKASTTAKTTARSRTKPITDKDEADVIWDFDMMKELGVSQHNMCSCSVTARRRPAVRQHVERRRRRAQQHSRPRRAQLLRDRQEHGKKCCGPTTRPA